MSRENVVYIYIYILVLISGRTLRSIYYILLCFRPVIKIHKHTATHTRTRAHTRARADEYNNVCHARVTRFLCLYRNMTAQKRTRA